MQLAEILSSTLSADSQTRELATEQLASALVSNPAEYLSSLSQVLAEEKLPSHIRNAAGLAIKNALSSRDSSRQSEFEARWNSLELATHQSVQRLVLQTLASSDRQARTVAGQIVAAIAAIDLPQGRWEDLIPQLLAFVSQPENSDLRQATLQAIGFLCESVPPHILPSYSNQLLTAIVQGGRKDEPSTDVQHAAIDALYNTLEFVKANFEREGERNFIMQVICEATQSPSTGVQVAAFGCLVRVMHLYYGAMKFYMERALFGLTILGMKHPDDNVVLQAIEFWSTVCDEEILIAMETEEAEEYHETPERESSHFARAALPDILPTLLMLLSRQDEDADEDEWNVSMAAGTCLALLAQTVEDAIVSPTVPFIEGNIRSQDWRLREASVMAFGSILDGPDVNILAPLVTQALPTLMELTKDPSPQVRDTIAWTLGRISELHIKTVSSEATLPVFISTLIQTLGESPRVAANGAWALLNVAEHLGDAKAETSALSPFVQPVIGALVKLSEQNNNESNSRNSGYEALSAFVSNVSNDSISIISDLTINILGRSEALVDLIPQLIGPDDRNNYNELQASNCSLITSVVRRMGAEVKPVADRIMMLMLRLLQTCGPKSPLPEDVFLCVGAVSTALEQDFLPYLTAFVPFVATALGNQEEYELCAVAVGLVGDICRAVGAACLPYCQGFMEVLLADLQSSTLNRAVKPPIISCFGDIALAIGANFEPFLDTTMNVLAQAGAIRGNSNNLDLVDYVIILREAILEAFTGIVAGLKSGGRAQILLPYINIIFTFLHTTLTDQDRPDSLLRGSLGLLGDIAEAIPDQQLREPLKSEWISEMLKAGRAKTASPETKRVAKWAKEVIKRVL